MRPRPDAAENPRFRPGARPGTASRFNEAAARCRGKPAQMAAVDLHGVASMRPRPDAAENCGAAATGRYVLTALQ